MNSDPFMGTQQSNHSLISGHTQSQPLAHEGQCTPPHPLLSFYSDQYPATASPSHFIHETIPIHFKMDLNTFYSVHRLQRLTTKLANLLDLATTPTQIKHTPPLTLKSSRQDPIWQKQQNALPCQVVDGVRRTEIHPSAATVGKPVPSAQSMKASEVRPTSQPSQSIVPSYQQSVQGEIQTKKHLLPPLGASIRLFLVPRLPCMDFLITSVLGRLVGHSTCIRHYWGLTLMIVRGQSHSCLYPHLLLWPQMHTILTLNYTTLGESPSVSASPKQHMGASCRLIR